MPLCYVVRNCREPEVILQAYIEISEVQTVFITKRIP